MVVEAIKNILGDRNMDHVLMGPPVTDWLRVTKVCISVPLALISLSLRLLLLSHVVSHLLESIGRRSLIGAPQDYSNAR